ncbi:hypothetical protein SNOG_05325 [Parastagonospora nodorum SN15]|uniref:Uncharacterized protein n=1 Tax=Phaeosphaeria nodorum (strain SN15 / ATCC MYA-4574 / FGSC 10173) TaxID=321614 RepID=Q0USD9_PHANO|nr:hypothetical protein SNOG_05325 [Parastagonospora nodorum SN15]EAT87716.1 hypothetical protein SNOG_05325 [Parastagonospora nodorum SN15]
MGNGSIEAQGVIGDQPSRCSGNTASRLEELTSALRPTLRRHIQLWSQRTRLFTMVIKTPKY